jgi:hypothetical protein
MEACMFRRAVISRGPRFIVSESHLSRVVCLLISMFVPQSFGFTIDKDSVNFADTSQFVFCFNTLGADITVDTIKVRRITSGTTSLGLALMFDTGHYCRTGCGVQGMNGNCNYYESGDNVYVESVPLRIRGHDSVKVTNLFFSTALVKKAESSQVGDLMQNVLILKFVSSIGECDSLRATVGSYFFDRTIRVNSMDEAASSLRISVTKRQDGLIIYCQPTNGACALFFIYNVIGQQVARFPQNRKNLVYWNPSDDHFMPGLYMVKGELPDKSLLTRTIMFTR